MTLADELVGYLQRKRCAMTVVRLAEDFKKPPQMIEATLAVLRREGIVQILRPGEWEIAPERPAAAEIIPPEPQSAIARARPLVPPASTDQPVDGTRAFTPYSRLTPPPKQTATTDDQEKSMSYKTCEKCKGKKGPRAFNKGKDVCRECEGGKHQGGVAPKQKANGSGRFAEAIGSLRTERDRLISEVSKIDSAIAQLTALG